MRYSLAATLSLALYIVASYCFAEAPAPTHNNDAAWTDCPASTARGELVWQGRSGRETRVVEEGRRILLDADSYPRRPARLVDGPHVTRDGNGYLIQFAIDRPDDVMVRVVGPDGRGIRRLGCGVLGPNAPEPFAKNKLEQRIRWDGRDSEGRPAPDGCRVDVSVGLSPKFERFVGYKPDQLVNYLSGLTVDPQGRVYVSLHTALRFDPVMVRFDREGNYLDMVYPSNPDNLRALGKTLDDVYSHVEHFGDRAVPIKEGLLRCWIQRWEDYLKFPFRIGRGGKGYFIIGTPTWLEQRTVVPDADCRIFTIDDLDHFWLQPSDGPWHYAPVFIFRWDAAFAFDGKGHVFIATKSFTGDHGDYQVGDPDALGTIRKVDLGTGKNVPAFAFNGEQKLAEKSVYLGTPRTVLSLNELDGLADRVLPNTAAGLRDPRDSDHSFFDIEDITIDHDGNILVADGHPRRIKVYGPEGRWRGAVDGLEFDGRQQRFLDLANIFSANDAIYVLSTYRDDPSGRMVLTKCTGPPEEPAVLWAVPLDPLARFIAVDAQAKPPLVWVGNGGGKATFTRIVDHGDHAGAPQHFGGIAPRTLVYPWTIAAADSGELFVHDYSRHQIIRTDDECTTWTAVDIQVNEHSRWAAERRRFAYKDRHHRDRELVPDSMLVDNRNRRLLVSTRANVDLSSPSPGLQAFDFEMNEQKIRLESPPDLAHGHVRWNGQARNWPWDTGVLWGPTLGGFDPQGNLYVTPIQWMRTDTIPEGWPSAVCKYGPDGSLIDRRHVSYYMSGGNMTVDSKGCVYVIDTGRIAPAKAGYDFPDMTWGYWIRSGPKPRGPYYMRRDGKPVTHVPEICHVVKFAPEGGERFGPNELWAHRGGSRHTMCGGCDFHANLLACDGADRIFVGDVTHYAVKVLDTAGNLIEQFGTYGNAETVPGEDADADDLGFRNIYSLSATGDALYVSDKDLRRVAKVRMDYRQTIMKKIP